MAEVGIIIVSILVCYPLYRLLRKSIKNCKCCKIKPVVSNVSNVSNISDSQVYTTHPVESSHQVHRTTPDIVSSNNLEEYSEELYEEEYYENIEEQDQQVKKSIKEFIRSNTNITKYKESVNGQKECIICLEEFKDNQNIRILQCMHYFHKKCIDDWLNKSVNCPECQYNILPK